jgi:hypothetical protein
MAALRLVRGKAHRKGIETCSAQKSSENTCSTPMMGIDAVWMNGLAVKDWDVRGGVNRVKLWRSERENLSPVGHESVQQFL